MSSNPTIYQKGRRTLNSLAMPSLLVLVVVESEKCGVVESEYREDCAFEHDLVECKKKWRI